MKRFWLGVAALSIVSACGGGNNVFNTGSGGGSNGGGSGGTPPSSGIVPEAIAGEIQSVTYDPTAQTLVVQGVRLDDTPFEVSYVRKPGLDQGGYEAYAAQDNPLSRHYIALVKERDGAYAAVTGSGQFATFLAGTNYGRSGGYAPPPGTSPTTGIVNYAGRYAGVLNVPGAQNDTLPVAPGTPNSVRPLQIATVDGLVFINADFANNAVEGTIIQRTVNIATDPFNTPLATSGETLGNVVLQSSDITADGTFEGTVGFGATDSIGSYGGVFAGPNASTVAGGVEMSNHVSIANGSSIDLTPAEEYGVFVLPACNTPDADPICP